MTAYDFGADGGLERRSQADELDGADPRAGAADRGRGGDRADRERLAGLRATTARRPTAADRRPPTAAARRPTTSRTPSRTATTWSRRATTSARSPRSTCVPEDGSRSSTRTSTRQAPGPELRRPGRRRMQGARRRLTPRPPSAPSCTDARASPRLAVVATAAEAAAPSRPPALPARAWVLVDADDGEVLAAHEASSSYSIASTTKLMTAYVARRELDLDDEVVAPPYDALAGRVAARARGGRADRGPRPALRPAAGLRQRRRRDPRPGGRGLRGRVRRAR